MLGFEIHEFFAVNLRGFGIGDQLVTWDAFDGLQTVVPALITSGLSGYSMQHADH